MSKGPRFFNNTFKAKVIWTTKNRRSKKQSNKIMENNYGINNNWKNKGIKQINHTKILVTIKRQQNSNNNE